MQKLCAYPHNKARYMIRGLLYTSVTVLASLSPVAFFFFLDIPSLHLMLVPTSASAQADGIFPQCVIWGAGVAIL